MQLLRRYVLKAPIIAYLTCSMQPNLFDLEAFVSAFPRQTLTVGQKEHVNGPTDFIIDV